MILTAMTQPDTKAPSHAINERICETRREPTERRGGSGATANPATGHPGPAAERPQGGRNRNTPPSERERMQTGLRILARMIARAHLRRQASGTAPEPPPER